MSASMSELEKDIEASRARLDEKIDQIQDRLNAAGLVDEMLGSARRTPLNGVYDSALEAVRRNPLPVLLIAAGVGLLIKGMTRGAQPARSRPAPLPPARAVTPAPVVPAPVVQAGAASPSA